MAAFVFVSVISITFSSGNLGHQGKKYVNFTFVFETRGERESPKEDTC